MKKIFSRKPSKGKDALSDDENSDPGFEPPPPRRRGESGGSMESAGSGGKKKRRSWLRGGGNGGRRKGKDKDDKSGAGAAAGQALAADLFGNLSEQSFAIVDALVASGMIHPSAVDGLGSSSTGAALSKRRNHKRVVYLEGPLDKRGQMFKTWHARHFVLTAHALHYFESERRYKEKALALGSLYFNNMFHEGGKVVNVISAALGRRQRIGNKPNLFCINCVGRTYYFSSETPELRDIWTENIDKAFAKFLRKKRRASRRAHRARSGRIEDRVTLFEDCRTAEDVDEEYGELVAKIVDDRTARRAFLAWRCFAAFSKRTGRGTAMRLATPVVRATSTRILRVPEF